MKIKPIDNKETYDNTRFNENTIGIINGIKEGTNNNAKSDYSAIVLISIMSELGFLKHALIKESFASSLEYVEKMEGDNV